MTLTLHVITLEHHRRRCSELATGVPVNCSVAGSAVAAPDVRIVVASVTIVPRVRVQEQRTTAVAAAATSR